MNNSDWIEDVRNQILDNQGLLNSLNAYADIFSKYSKFKPNVYFSKYTKCLGLTWGDHIDGILDVIINLNFSGGTFKKGSFIYDLSKVTEFDFPELKIELCSCSFSQFDHQNNTRTVGHYQCYACDKPLSNNKVF